MHMLFVSKVKRKINNDQRVIWYFAKLLAMASSSLFREFLHIKLNHTWWCFGFFNMCGNVKIYVEWWFFKAKHLTNTIYVVCCFFAINKWIKIEEIFHSWRYKSLDISTYIKWLFVAYLINRNSLLKIMLDSGVSM